MREVSRQDIDAVLNAFDDDGKIEDRLDNIEKALRILLKIAIVKAPCNHNHWNARSSFMVRKHGVQVCPFCEEPF